MKPLIVANWKMNPINKTQAEEIAKVVESSVKKSCDIVVCPPFIFIEKVGSILNKVNLGSQNCSWEVKGSLTGEVSPKMLKDFGVQYVIIGHSERRTIFRESNEIINKKVKAVLKEGLSVILCVGETKEDKNNRQTEEILGVQLKEGLDDVEGKVIIAYEPVWAIGSGNSCDSNTAEKSRKFIKEKMNKLSFNDTLILYGGSVNSENATNYLNKASFSGLLIGEASLDIEEFKKIISLLNKNGFTRDKKKIS